MSIPTLSKKIKSFIEGEKGKDILVFVTLVCVALSSFYLGKLSVVENKTQNNVVVKFDPSITDYFYKDSKSGEGSTPTLSASKENTNDILTEGEEVLGSTLQESNTSNSSEKAMISSTEEKGDIVASSRGSKYYYTYCSGAKTLSESNKIYFSSETEAEANGYTLSSSCTKK